MIDSTAISRAHHANISHESEEKTVFGFWIYILTDCMLFASLFATFIVLRNNTAGGHPSSELFSLPFVLTETLILLTSSYFCGLAILAMRRRNKDALIKWLILTGALGLAFLGLELYEFNNLVQEGNGWQRSAFLSAFFTLVGTHGLHITSGLIWVSVLVVQILKKGITAPVARRVTLFSLFWHFLDIVWIFIFTLVYLLGAQ